MIIFVVVVVASRKKISKEDGIHDEGKRKEKTNKRDIERRRKLF